MEDLDGTFFSLSTVKYETRDQIAWVTLNRPEALNALNSQVFDALQVAFLEATNNNDILAIVLTSEGGKAFYLRCGLQRRK